MEQNRYSFSTGALYPLESEDALRLIGAAGFCHAELMPQAFGDITEEASKRYESCKVHIASIHYPLALFAMLYSGHRTMSEEGRRYSAELTAFARRMDTEFIVIHPTAEYAGDMKELIEPKVLENIRFLSDACQKQGIRLAMENYPSGVGQYPETLEKYIESLDMPGMLPMVDTTEVIEGGGDPVEFLGKLSQAPCHLHLSDFKDGKKHLPIGQGIISWDRVFAVLKEKGYTGYYTLEPAYRYYLKDIPARLARDFEFLHGKV